MCQLVDNQEKSKIKELAAAKAKSLNIQLRADLFDAA
jgi:hypothetical protein